MNVIADTGFVVAFLSKADNYNGWAVETAARVNMPILTCEAVVAETAFHMKSATPVLEMVREGMIEIGFNAQVEITHLRELAKRFSDRRPDFADLCLIRMSELYPRYTVLTTDEHDFRVYRRNKRDAIPLLCPPRRQ